MNFASPYVYNNVTDESYEVVSDEEFMEGMDLSDSGGSGDELGEEEAPGEVTAAAQEASTANTSSDRKARQADAKPPGMLHRAMGMLSSLGSRTPQPPPPPPPPAPPLPPRSKSTKSHHWKSAPQSHSHSHSHSKDSRSKGKMFRRAHTNIVSLRFDTLKKPSTMHAGETIKCAGCEAMMSNISGIEDDGPDKVWKCEFCGYRNLVDIDEDEKPAADDVTYLIEAALSTTTCGTSGRDESIVVFCIDISGSMTITTEVPGHQKLRGSATLRRLRRENTMEGPQRLPHEGRNVTYVSRLQAVQAAVDHQLGEMARDFPDRRVALVTFSSDVSVIGDGTGEPVSVSGQKLTNQEELTKVGLELPLPKAVKDVRESLGEKIFGLEEGGSTALGPAIVVALSLASQHPGSKVILCTDGKSNEGVGKVENLTESDPEPDEFYENIAATANSKGVSVSVVTISGTDCKLIQLGKLADSTGGQVNIVDPLKLTEEFSNVLSDRIIATSVVATFIVHKGLYIGQEENSVCRERREIGNVNSDHEISFEFGVRRRKEKKKGAKGSNPLEGISEVPTSLEEKASNSTGGGGDSVIDDVEMKDISSAPTPQAAEAPSSSDDTPTPTPTTAEAPSSSDATPTPTPTTAEAPSSSDATPITPTPTTAEAMSTSGTANPTAEAPSVSGSGAGGAGSEEEAGGAPEDIPPELPFQVQITYTDMDGTKALRVLTQKKPVTNDRHVSERDVDLNVLALHTERRTSELALMGDYTGSRGVALMNQRLGWRSSHNSTDESRRKWYRKAFSRVQTVENTVSHKQRQERLTYGRTHSDDEDEDEPMALTARPEQEALRSASGASAGAQRSGLLRKMRKMRSEEVDDSMAHILYKGRSASTVEHSGRSPPKKPEDKGSKK
ncbi:uncharacterized protein LOC143297936 [Babylonia areolata]|uniref:uncharacterized protein LOC143297936 n=1 Tax=Babylonia areolata TaxID=304850 RepID=UPI003FD0E06B